MVCACLRSFLSYVFLINTGTINHQLPGTKFIFIYNIWYELNNSDAPNQQSSLEFGETNDFPQSFPPKAG